MKRLKLRKGAIVGIYTAIFVFTGVGAYLVSQNMKKDLIDSLISSNEKSILQLTHDDIKFLLN